MLGYGSLNLYEILKKKWMTEEELAVLEGIEGENEDDDDDLTKNIQLGETYMKEQEAQKKQGPGASKVVATLPDEEQEKLGLKELIQQWNDKQASFFKLPFEVPSKKKGLKKEDYDRKVAEQQRLRARQAEKQRQNKELNQIAERDEESKLSDSEIGKLSKENPFSPSSNFRFPGQTPQKSPHQPLAGSEKKTPDYANRFEVFEGKQSNQAPQYKNVTA